MLDENLTLKKHIELIESKMSKNIGIIYKAKFLLNKTCLKIYIFLFYSKLLNLCKYSMGEHESNKTEKNI